MNTVKEGAQEGTRCAHASVSDLASCGSVAPGVGADDGGAQLRIPLTVGTRHVAECAEKIKTEEYEYM